MRRLCLLPLLACSAKVGAPTKSGVVGGATAAYVESGASRVQSSAGASFSATADPAACSRVQADGACTTLLCAVTGGASDAPSAGTITIRAGGRTVTLTPGADHTYPAWQDGSTALFAAGDTVAIDASGGEVPAFSGTVIAPDVATIRAPVLPQDAAPLAIARGTGLDVAWDALGGTTIELALSGAGDGGRRALVTCSFDGASGAGHVAAGALAAVQGGDASVSIVARSARKVDAGDYAVQLQADTQAHSPDGRRFVAIVSLQ